MKRSYVTLVRKKSGAARVSNLKNNRYAFLNFNMSCCSNEPINNSEINKSGLQVTNLPQQRDPGSLMFKYIVVGDSGISNLRYQLRLLFVLTNFSCW